MANPDFFLKIRRKLKSYTRWLRKVPEGLWVMTPVNLPLYGSRIGRWLNRILLVAQLRVAMLLLAYLATRFFGWRSRRRPRWQAVWVRSCFFTRYRTSTMPTKTAHYRRR